MPTKKSAAKPAKDKKPGVGDLAIELLRAGKSNEDVLAAVTKKFPDSSVSISSISWYRNKLRSDGEKVPTAREVRAKAAKAAKK